jgi:hypothetical protein
VDRHSFPDLFEPLPPADGPDAAEIGPNLDPMRHRGLKPFQVLAGILFTLAAELDASPCRAGGHCARPAVGSLFPTGTRHLLSSTGQFRWAASRFSLSGSSAAAMNQEQAAQ